MATSAVPSCIAQFPLFICHVNTLDLFPPSYVYLLTLWLRRGGACCIYQNLDVELEVEVEGLGDCWIQWVFWNVGLQCDQLMYHTCESMDTSSRCWRGRNAISFGRRPHPPPHFAAIRFGHGRHRRANNNFTLVCSFHVGRARLAARWLLSGLWM